MKILLKIILLLVLPVLGIAQQNIPDSLRKIYYNSKEDSILYKAGIHLFDYYEEVNRDSAFFYADQCVQISRRNNKKINEAHVLTRKSLPGVKSGPVRRIATRLLASFEICQTEGNDNYYWDVGTLSVEKKKKLYALNCAHHIYRNIDAGNINNDQSIIHFKEAKRIAVEIK
jgi:hypothetical protein